MPRKSTIRPNNQPDNQPITQSGYPSIAIDKRTDRNINLPPNRSAAATQSINRPINQASSQSIRRPTHLPNRPINQTLNQSGNQSNNQTNKQAIGRSQNLPIRHAIENPRNREIDPSRNQPFGINKPTNRPIAQSASRAAKQAFCHPCALEINKSPQRIRKSTNQPPAHSINLAIDTSTIRPYKQSTNRRISKSSTLPNNQAFR